MYGWPLNFISKLFLTHPVPFSALKFFRDLHLFTTIQWKSSHAIIVRMKRFRIIKVGSKRCVHIGKSKTELIIGPVQLARRTVGYNTVKIHTHSISAERANRWFRTHGLSGSNGLQDIAAETRKRVNVSTLSLTSIRLVRHRINGVPQFPSTLYRARTIVHPCHFVYWLSLASRR